MKERTTHSPQCIDIEMQVRAMQAKGTSILPPGKALSAIQAAGEGFPLWQAICQVLEDEKDTKHKSRNGTLACMRSTCKQLQEMSYPLMTEVTHLTLGSAGSRALYSDLTAFWHPLQVEQYHNASKLLLRLSQLRSLTVLISDGGASQLVRLLEQGGCWTQNLETLQILFGWVTHA